ncbi:MAG: L-lactate dehydrogenase [Bacillota bacterium]|nr:L-lactate dehydrogenase [Bacillota bacterium]
MKSHYGPKLAVVGSGYVGSAAAYTIMLSGLARELVLVDKDRAKAEGHALDLLHGSPLTAPVSVRAGDYEDCRGSDIILFCAGSAQKPGQSRLQLVQVNLEALRDTIPAIARLCPQALLVMVSNPVDVLTQAALHLTRWPPERVIGSGTVLDSARFRQALGHHFGVDPRNVHAYVVGEHGDSEVPLWSRATVAGLTVPEFETLTSRPVGDPGAFFSRVREAAGEVISRKGATYYAIAVVLRRILQAILNDQRSVLTVSGLVEGAYGITGVCLSLPTIVGRRGREKVLAPPLAEQELEALSRSARVLAGFSHLAAGVDPAARESRDPA